MTRNAVIGKSWRLNLPDRPIVERKPRTERNSGGIWQRIDSMLRDANRVAAALPIDSSPCAKTFSELIGDRSQCRWALTTPDGEEQLFCAADVVPDMPYCPRHCKAAYRKRAA
jgi:hypothetical protein